MRISSRNTLLPLLLTILILLTSCGVQAISLNLVPMQPTEENMTTTRIIDPASEVRGVWIASVFNIDYPSAADLDAAEELLASITSAGDTVRYEGELQE